MLEKMAQFFEARLEGYDAHMMKSIAYAEEFYSFTAACLPRLAGAQVLDLGCGTGLELESYFGINPGVHVTGVDLSSGMLAALKEKFPDKNLTLICGSYFDVDFEENLYDAAVSVESLHHFTGEEKLPLYAAVCAALKPGGYFILTDYFAQSDEEENRFRQELLRLKTEQGIADGEFYHFDTPLTAAHEMEVLRKAGFSQVEQLGSWGATHTVKAVK